MGKGHGIASRKKESEVTQSCPTLCDPMDTRLLCPWDFLGKSTGVGCYFLPQGIFPDPGIEPRSPALYTDALPSEPQGTCIPEPNRNDIKRCHFDWPPLAQLSFLLNNQEVVLLKPPYPAYWLTVYLHFPNLPSCSLLGF